MGIARAQIILENVERSPHDIAQATFDAFMRFEVQYLECIDDVTAGSCALTVVLQDDTLHVANCGDCRAVLYKVLAHPLSMQELVWVAVAPLFLASSCGCGHALCGARTREPHAHAAGHGAVESSVDAQPNDARHRAEVGLRLG